MNVDDLVAHYKSQSRAAQKLGLSRATVSIWRRRGIPLGQQALIQIATRGRLRADRKGEHEHVEPSAPGTAPDFVEGLA
jgi:transposase